MAATDRVFIERCYALAAEAVEAGNHPFGALLVLDGEIVLEQRNTVLTENDLTNHAELCLVRAASKKFDEGAMSRATLYSSTEPCAMCSGAIYWSGINRVVFGVSGADLGALVGEKFLWSSAELYQRANRSIQVVGPIAATIGRKLHQEYWT